MPRGRKPKNPKLLEKEGAYRANPSRKPARELTVIEGTPEPTVLIMTSNVMIDLWNQTCELLSSLEIINKTDKLLLETFVVNYAMVLDLSGKVMQSGHAQATSTGQKRSPDSQALQAHTDRHIKLMAELGLTPSARARFADPVSVVDKSNPLLDVMKELKN